MPVVKEKLKKLINMRKGNESTKVSEEFVETYLKAGWKKVVVVKGKRDPETNMLLEGEEDVVKLEGIEEDTVKDLKAANKLLKKEIADLKAQLAK